MNNRYKHIFNKLVLIVIAEIVAISLTDAISFYVVPIKHTTFSYLICGAFLAIVVVNSYDHFLTKRKERIECELKELTNVALRKYENINK